jgi:type II secretory pathway pseudopilin PulG
MANERPIEKLLRRYAKKRRDGAGAPAELHPAARRLLQGEVARKFKKERSEIIGPEESPVRWWPRLVYGLCALAVVAVLAVTFLPASNKASSRSLGAKSANNLRQIDRATRTFAVDNNDRLPASFDQLSNELGTSTVTVDPVTGKPFVYVAGGLPLKSLRSDSVLAYSPPTNGRSSVLMADGRVQQMSAPEFAEISKRGLIQFEVPLELAKNEDFTASPSRELKLAKAADASDNRAAGTTTEDFPKLMRAESPAPSGMGGGGGGAEPTTQAAPATIAPAPRREVAGKEEPVATAVAGAVAAAPALMPAATPPPATAPALKLDGFGDTSAAFYSANDVTKTNAMAVNVASYVNLDESRAKREGGAAGNLAENQTSSFRNVQKTPTKTQVLDSFQVEQNGNALRVIDNDGSTYDGNIVSTEAETAAGAGFGLADKLDEKAADRKKVSAGELSYKAVQNSPSQNYFFRVAGTNRTLKQQVVFTGNFVSTTNAVQLGTPPTASQQVQNFQFFINNSTIVGKAQVEKNSEINVNAVPISK